MICIQLMIFRSNLLLYLQTYRINHLWMNCFNLCQCIFFCSRCSSINCINSGDSYNNVVRRYSSSNNLSYEDCVKINMILEEHFNKEKESAVADAAAAEPVAEASQSEADASSEVEATPELAATPEMKEFIQRIFQIPNNLD